ncbi:MAG: calcium/sodium antiporter [Candidatus ainarchaeum sp.]|nr:calcium/sodium antiporter [Candidatus ainarchaeum sp.]MDD5096279.1 calcium/sodium antiporter [Candidatus ainarchaeum sp.]
MLLELAILLVSLAALAWSANLVSDKAVVLSEYFHISQMAIGFLLIAASTSIPELAVSVMASITGQGAISAGNVFGSNIADIFLVIGACAFFYKIVLRREDAIEVGGVLLVTSVITLYFIYSTFVLGYPVIGRLEGAVLLLAFGAYIYYVLKKKKFTKNGDNGITKKDALRAFALFFVGVTLVLISSGLAVDSAVKLSELAGISQSFIGATILAVGTSLPELSVELAAVKKKRYALAIGDAIGSTITNITLVLGVASLLNPITILAPASFLTILLFAMLANIIFFYMTLAERKIGRVEGALLLLSYVAFLAVLVGAEKISVP